MEKNSSKKYLIAGALLILFAVFVLVKPIFTEAVEANGDEQYEQLKTHMPDSTTTFYSADVTPPPPDFSTSNDKNEDEIFDVVEEEPQFSGGENAMQEFIKSKVKYPEIAIQMGDQGKVYVRFVVEKNGSVTNLSIA